MYKKIRDISVIVSSNNRSLVYLKVLEKNGFLPNKIIFLKDPKKNIYNKKIFFF